MHPSEARMGLIEHLADLRTMLVRSLWGIILGFALAYAQSEKLFDLIRAPIQPYLPEGGLVFTGPIDKFFAHLKVSFFTGIIFSAPWWMYQVWRFVAPALYKNERKATVTFMSVAILLFSSGMAFTYFIVFPMAFKFLLEFGGNIDKPMITISEYLDFFIWTSLSFGAAFELPLIVVTLGLLGIVNTTFLKANRKYVIVALSVLTAIITPPDLLSMLMMLVPLWLLFDASVLIVVWLEKKRA